MTDFIDGCLAVTAGTVPYHVSGSRIAPPGPDGPRRTHPALIKPAKMTPSLHIDIAEAILWFHVVVIAFSVLGLVAIPLGAWGGWRGVRVFWWRALHIGILGIVALQAALGRACFLTIWESDLLRLAGQAASDEPLIQQWASRAIYWPLPLWIFAVLYVTVCVYALLLWWLVPPRFPWQSASSSG